MPKIHFDPYLLICAIVLSALGLTTIASVAPSLFWTQFFFVSIGLILFVIFSNIDYRIFGSLSKIIYGVSIFALLTTLFFGIASHGAVRWIEILGLRLQFSEVLKPFLICFIAYFLSSLSQNKLKLFYAGIVSLPVIFLVFKQPDLGGAIVYFGAISLMVFVSGIGPKTLLVLFTSGIAGLPIFWHFLSDYQKKRLVNFANPTHDVLGSGYNAAQSIITVGSGSFFGKGLGRGTQTHLLFLPEHHTDFIFASYAEEFGFVGSFGLVAVFFILFSRLLIIIQKTNDPFAKLVVVGILGLYFVQTFINIGMNIGIVPVTGITLPLVSYGGSSILSCFIGLGIVSNINCQLEDRSSLR